MEKPRAEPLLHPEAGGCLFNFYKETIMQNFDIDFEKNHATIWTNAKSEIALGATHAINILAAINGKTVATNEKELKSYIDWFLEQIEGCDEYIQSQIEIEVKEEKNCFFDDE